MSDYTPAPGDLVWLDFNPQAGHEQAGHRPAMVLSKRDYNQKTGLAIFCPITSKVKGYPFEVQIVGKGIEGVVLSDQIKSMDWKARNAKFIEKADDIILQDVLARLSVILD